MVMLNPIIEVVVFILMDPIIEVVVFTIIVKLRVGVKFPFSQKKFIFN